MVTDIEKQAHLLATELRKCDESYYNHGKRLVSDQTYDEKRNRLIKIMQENPGLEVAYDFGIKDNSMNRFNETTHQTKMYSLANIYSYEGYVEWISGLVAKLEKSFKIHVSTKRDGISSSIRYNKPGDLLHIALRGSGGLGGQIVTPIYRLLNEHIPKKISRTDKVDGDIEVRGEIYIEKHDFDLFNKRANTNYTSPLAMTVAMAQKASRDPQVNPPIQFNAYDCPMLSTQFQSHTDMMKYIKEILGFSVVDMWTIDAMDHDAFKAIYEEADKKRHQFAADGLVVRIDDLEISRSMGWTSHHPKFAMAVKFTRDEESTTITAFDHTIGTSNKLTPRALLKPVTFKEKNKTCSFVNVHNPRHIQEKGYGVGAVVEIYLAGGILAQLGEVISPPTSPYQEPSCCPYCQDPIRKTDSGVLFCTNDLCIGVLTARIREMFSILKIRNITLEDIVGLIEHREVIGPTDLLTISKFQFIDALGEKRGTYVFNKIDTIREKGIPLPLWLQIMSIPLLTPSRIKQIIEHPNFTIADSLDILGSHVTLQSYGLTEEASTAIAGYVQKNQSYLVDQFEKMIELIS